MTSCASYDEFKKVTEEYEFPSRVFRADFNQTWQAVIKIMKKYEIAQQNQESGYIKTRWIDNTLQLNFTNSFGSGEDVKVARFKLVINVTRGFAYGGEVSKVTVYKKQLIEKDFLQGLKPVFSEGILEKTILYRIETIIANDNKLKELDKELEREQLESF